MPSSLRVLMVSDVSPLHIEGGGERVLWEQARRLVQRGHRVCIVSRSPGDATPEVVERQGVRIRHFSTDRRSLRRFLQSSILEARRIIAQELAETGADVLHAHQPLSGYGVLCSPAGRRLPSLYTFHSPAPLEYRFRHGTTGHHRGGMAGGLGFVVLWIIERACLKKATRIHVLSDFSAGLLWKLYRISSDRIVRIPGGADTQRFRPARDRDAVRRTLGLPVGSPLLLTVRNLEARMGLDNLIRAMSILRRQVPDVLLLIGGSGSLRRDLESLADSLDLQGHVRFLGYIPESDLPRYYQVADLFVLPTRALEGFGLVTVEALACGTPVLGTAVGATPEILLSLDPSLVFRDATPEAMADDLGRFLDANPLGSAASQSLRQACLRHAELHYTWELSVARLGEVLSHLAHDRSEPPVAGPCPACSSMIRDRDLAYLGASYLRCSRCQTGVVARLPTAAFLRRQYELEYPLRFRPEEVTEPRAELFGSILDHLSTLATAGHLLDVGCGGGHLLAAASQRGWRGLGTDLSHRACVVAQKTGAPMVQAEGAGLPLRDECVSTVSLINVLDHTPDPFGTLREAFRVLIPGGHLVVRVPNAAFHRPWIRLLTSLGPLVRWHGWDGYPILHIFAFTPGGLGSLVNRAGFQILQIRNSSPAAEGFGSPPRGLRAGGLHWLHRLVLAGTASLRVLSGGRWLVGPSIELYAERPAVRAEGNP